MKKKFINLEKIDSEFRILTDLFFSELYEHDKIDLNKYKELFQKNYKLHFDYFLDRFKKSSNTYYYDNYKFWDQKFTFIYKLQFKFLNRDIKNYIENRVIRLIESKHMLNTKYQLPLIQYIECNKNKIKKTYRMRYSALNVIHRVNIKKLLNIIDILIPYVYKDTSDYIDAIIKEIPDYYANLDILFKLLDNNVPIDVKKICELAESNILCNNFNCNYDKYSFIKSLLQRSIIFDYIKSKYQKQYGNNFISFLDESSLDYLKSNNFDIIKKIISLDSSLTDEIMRAFVSKLNNKYYIDNRGKSDLIIKFLKSFPEISPKKMILALSNSKNFNVIKYIVKEYPQLQSLMSYV